MKITLVGDSGRMGMAVLACVARMPQLTIVGRINQKTSAFENEQCIAKCDVVVDFSSPAATRRTAELCAESKKPLVTGTTGHSEAEEKALLRYSVKIPIVQASNFSTGVNTLFWLTRKAAEILGPDFDLEVIEMHHRLKKDAPSGTAKALGEILADVRKLKLWDAGRHGRIGMVGERTSKEIGMHSIRGGDVVGDHTVIFANTGERVELTHKASSRETFAGGALRAAEWILTQGPGLYSMQRVLGLVP